VLEELAGVDAALELVVAEEVVLAPVLLTAASRTRGRGDRDDVAIRSSEEPSDERALTGPRRAGDDEQPGQPSPEAGSARPEQRDELVALALGETADRLGLADAALVQATRRLDAPEFR
jgi:hypothetical protein